VGADAGAAGADERRARRTALLAAAGSRLLVLLAGLITALTIGLGDPPWTLIFPRRAAPFEGLLGQLLNPWGHWDGVWYIKIAVAGYAEADGSTAFFPLYPLLLRYGGVLFDGNLLVTGLVISLACFAGAMVLLYRLVREQFDARTAALAVTMISVIPTSLFFQAVYTESLFLLLSLACVLWSRHGRWRLAGLAALLATLTRSTGVLLLVPMAILYYEQRGWDVRRTDQHVANLLLVPLGLLMWMTYLSLTFGRPLLFAVAQEEWRRALAAPTVAVGRGIAAAVLGAAQLLSGQNLTLYWPVPKPSSAFGMATHNLISLAFFIVFALLLYYGFKRLPRADWWYFMVASAYPLFFPAGPMPLLSYPRFMLTIFPAFTALALFLRDRPRAQLATIVLFLVALALLTGKFTHFSWVA
jgi:hypothetical protein